ncbi:MAG: tol-pal system-associated acyl-CoA thioesterase [Gammaproteobacteria bacterium]|nr:tol-pal system-associated acyl-CoA thioesterase [Gammaproteobacteria bacterium]MCP4992775.1 tol-pal system-associated acyl-CoA thioesterase [Gammaproteobacteria bacterium]
MEFIWPVRVYYEDTDAGGVVYYANYLKFMERARTEWLRSQGFEQDRLRDEQGVIFVLRKLALDYRSPARLDDLLQVGVRIKNRGRASLTFFQEIATEQESRVLCAGDIQIACVDALTFRPTPLPQNLIAVIDDAV